YTLGGPVQIPKLFNGKNRLFFMSNFEEYKSRLTSPTLITTLPAEMRRGDFSSILPYGYVLYDPTSRVGSTLGEVVASQAPFSGNIIPPNRLSPQSQLLLDKWYPLPNLPQTTAGLPFRNYQYGLKIPVDKDTLTTRIDFN